jgi:DNA polymerase-4
MRTALRLCPSAVRVSPHFDRYREVSGQVFAILRRWTPLVEPLSLDEAYLDVSTLFDDATVAPIAAAAARLKAEVHSATGLTLSVGAGATKSVAKIASDLRKPDGLVVVPAGQERAFLAPLPIGRLWGVGPKAEERLLRIGVRTIGDLAALDRRWVEGRYGRWGALLHDLAQGRDTRAVCPERETKSVSSETTFAEDTGDAARLTAVLTHLAEQVARRLQRHGVRGRTVTLKLRDAAFQTHTRQTTLAAATDQADVIAGVAQRLLAVELHPGRRFRLIGVAVSGFRDAQQLALPL